MTQINIDGLREIAEVEFADIVEGAMIPSINELRIIINDGNFLDVWYSLKLVDRYSYHWERRAIDGTIYRHDNAPHRRWQSVKSFPRHFHDGCETNVVESQISSNPQEAIREFLAFIRGKTKNPD